MNYETIKKYLNKKCLVILNNKFSYFGIIKETNENNTTMFDKYETLVSIENIQISVIIEKKDEEEK